jgi:outer membrane protein assembly factor BamD
MHNKTFHNALIVVFTAIIAFSCSQYEKVIKGDDVDLKFTKAFEYYSKGDYVKAGALFDQLAPITRGTRRADSVYFYQAMTQYKLNDFIVAGHYFNTFVILYSNSKLIEEAAYMEAYCYYEQSPRAELDQTSTYQALDAFRLYMIKYPSSPRIEDCERIVNELNEKLMEKAFVAARLYFNLNNYKAAIVSLNTCLVEYPDSKNREEMMFMLLESKYMLASKSIFSKQTERYQDVVDEYYSFIAEFPESKNKNEADNIFEKSSKYVKVSESEISNN